MTVLDEIIAGVREDLGARRAITSLEAIKQAAAAAGAARPALAARRWPAPHAARAPPRRGITPGKP
ncbi:MAG: indole-3-glycerol-phosphate synthase TrpC, partial [Glutamicibacter sp.]